MTSDLRLPLRAGHGDAGGAHRFERESLGTSAGSVTRWCCTAIRAGCRSASALGQLELSPERRGSGPGLRHLQHEYSPGLPAGAPLFCVTLNPDAPVDDRYVWQRFVYEHPLFNPQSWSAQLRARLTASSGAGTAAPTGTTAFMRMGCAARSTWCRASPWRRATEMNSCLYQGVLRHRRLQPKAHHFVYRLFMAGSTSTNWTSCLRRASAAPRPPPPVRRRLSAGRAAEGPVLNRLESLTGCRPAGA